MVDDVVAHLGQTVNVGLARTIVAPLDGIVKKTVDTVAVVGVVFGGVDTPLGGNTVCAARAVVDAEAHHVEAQFAKAGGSCRTGQTSAHNDDVEPAFVGRVYQILMCLIISPLFRQGAFGNFGVEFGHMAYYFLNGRSKSQLE